MFAVSNKRIRTSIIGCSEQMFDVASELAATLALAPPSNNVCTRKRDFLAADELFLAGISCGVVPIVRVNKKTIGSGTEGPITRRIREAYRKLTRGEL